MSPSALPIPPSGIPVFNPITGAIDTQWQNYFLQLTLAITTGAAPADAQFWVSTLNASLTSATDIGSLATGYLKIVTAAGVATPSTTPTIPVADISGIVSSTYTPTLTAVANVTASTAFVCQYVRVGSVVTVSGKIAIDPTLGATLTQLGISLPVASNFSAAEQCGGTGVAAVPSYAGSIAADAANDRAELDFTTVADVANQDWFFSFTYQVL